MRDLFDMNWRLSPVVVSLLSVLAAWAQTQLSVAPAFEVASVKVAAPSNASFPGPVMRGGPGTNSPGQFTCTGASVRDLVTRAWDLGPYQLSGPRSMADSKYDITAKIPPDTSNEDFKLMLQHLLAERIGLVVHHEAQEQTVYELGIAKGGLKMRQAEPAPANEPPSDPTASADGKPPTIHLVTDKDGNQQLPPGHPMSIVTGVGGVIRRMARMEEMPQVVRMLEQRAGHPVIDKTGLTGQYDFVLEFAPDTPAARPMDLSAAAPAEASTPAPFFFDAVVQQLGLKLEPKKASVDVLIVDSFNKVPTEN